MSTFAVFGMTRSFALAEARKKTPVRELRGGGGSRTQGMGRPDSR